MVKKKGGGQAMLEMRFKEVAGETKTVAATAAVAGSTGGAEV